MEKFLKVGTVLGYKKLRAIIDFQSQLKLNGKIKAKDITHFFETLEILKLPHNYEWVIKTPSNGFHIIFYCEQSQFQNLKKKEKNVLNQALN